MIGVADEIKGQVPRGLVVLKAGATAERLAEELIALMTAGRRPFTTRWMRSSISLAGTTLS